MRTSIHDTKVIFTKVSLVSIDVMNNHTVWELSTKHVCCDSSMYQATAIFPAWITFLINVFVVHI